MTTAILLLATWLIAACFWILIQSAEIKRLNREVEKLRGQRQVGYVYGEKIANMLTGREVIR